MKTNNFKKISTVIAIMAITMLSANTLFAQFIGTAQVDQTAIEERKGDLSTYTILGTATDEYSWQIVGPAGITITPAPDGGTGTAGDPYVLNYAVGLQSITVQWVADDNTITSLARNVSVQRQVQNPTIQCPSSIQSMDISLWSEATIAIQDADYAICSGDATAGDITVNFTGAPDFDFKYTITDLTGTTGLEQLATVTGASTTIAIPANLVNTSTIADQTYIVTITEMNDSFTGFGTITDATITITVHPTVETGDISSDNTLTRR